MSRSIVSATGSGSHGPGTRKGRDRSPRHEGGRRQARPHDRAMLQLRHSAGKAPLLPRSSGAATFVVNAIRTYPRTCSRRHQRKMPGLSPWGSVVEDGVVAGNLRAAARWPPR